MLWIILFGWIVCGVLSAGMSYAYVQKEYTAPSREDTGFAVLFGFFGPIALLVSFCLTGFAKHGWKAPGT